MAKFPILPSVAATLRNWTTGLLGLRFDENFRGYEWIGRIEAGEEVRITHEMKLVPTRFVVLWCDGVNTLVIGQELPANITFFYLKNIATSGAFFGRVMLLP